jgi:hypothetical protein
MKIIIYEKIWTKDTVSKDKDSLYIYGDNDIGKGCRGQAVIRYLPNAIGIPTKKIPNNLQSSFYTDIEFEQNKKNITNAIEKIKKASINYSAVVFPKDGFGTGLAMLKTKAPETFDFMETQVELLKSYLKNN